MDINRQIIKINQHHRIAVTITLAIIAAAALVLFWAVKTCPPQQHRTHADADPLIALATHCQGSVRQVAHF